MATPNDAEMSLVGHLDELRTRLIICCVALFVCLFIAFPIAKPVLEFLTAPIGRLHVEPKRTHELTLEVAPDGSIRLSDPAVLKDPETLTTSRFNLVFKSNPSAGLSEDVTVALGQDNRQKLRYPSPLDPFMLQFKVALVLALLLSGPVLLWQLWGFISPGLTDGERRVVRPLLGGALVLFPLGATFAYYMALLILVVMQRYQISNIEPFYDASRYLSMLTTMMVVFGLIFELPLAMALAARIGLIHPRMLTQYRRHAYVGLAFAAMVLTPADPFSMIAVLIPLIVLYEFSIALCKPLARLHEREKLQSAEEPLQE